MNEQKDKSRLQDVTHKLQSALETDREKMGHEISELLAGADRDVFDLRHGERLSPEEFSHISERMQKLAVKFESEHPRISRLAEELASLLRNMGI